AHRQRRVATRAPHHGNTFVPRDGHGLPPAAGGGGDEQVTWACYIHAPRHPLYRYRKGVSDVRFWLFSDIPRCLLFCRCWGDKQTSNAPSPSVPIYEYTTLTIRSSATAASSPLGPAGR